MTRQLALGDVSFLTGEIVADWFCGGGGASEGITRALGRAPTIAINHDAHSIRMHAANHPQTIHLKEDVWNVHPVRDLPAGPIGLAWFSPSCTFFSRARGSKPVTKQLRALAWVAARLAKHRRPRVIMLENVAEFQKWGPLDADGTPTKAAEGVTFKRFLARFRKLGYAVDFRILDAAHYGAPTHRKRLFFVARCDGLPIAWPDPTHGPGRARPFRTAAECIDWSLPCPSIFTRSKPLAEATQRRIAEGVRRFVLENPKPFLVGTLAPFLVQTGHGEREGQSPRVRDIRRPWPTTTASGGQPALVAAFLAKHYGGVVGHGVDRPLGTVTTVDHHSAVAVHLTKFYGSAKSGAPVDEPAPTVTSGGGKGGGHAGLVAAFLTRYFGESVGARVDNGPSPTACAVNHTGLVTVAIDGETFALVDIGMRMLTPRELASCQGFGPDYVLFGTQAEQVARIGNSVAPPVAEALVRANMVRAVAEAAE